MSESTPETPSSDPSAADTPTEADHPPTDAPPSEGPEPEGDSPSREAARYRTRLRETEAERDLVVERLAGYQRREIERLAGARLSRPGDVWMDGRPVAELLAEDGTVDPNRVDAEVEQVLDGRPQLDKTYERDRDYGAGKRSSTSPGGGWQEVLQGR